MGELNFDKNTNIWMERRYKHIPTGIKNINEKVITLEHFKHRIRAVKDQLKKIDKLNFELFKNRLERSKLNKIEPFLMLELDTVLNNLKMGKCRDPKNYVSELLKKM